MSDFFEIRDRLKALYSSPTPAHPSKHMRAETLGEEGFLTEIAGRVILTAPAKPVTLAEELPRELAERWEQAARGNPYMMWLQGRFVEAEKANRNGAFWSTEDLQFGEMSVRHGPLNWLHEEQTIIGTIADNALIHPQLVDVPTAAMLDMPEITDAESLRQAIELCRKAGNPQGMKRHIMARAQALKMTNALPSDWMSDKADLLATAQPRPYMAAVSAVWKWVHPEKVAEIERAAESGRLYYSMECIAREMSCVSDETHNGCGQSFDYITAMTQPQLTCEHIQARSSARRMVDPAFLGGAVIVPPTQPGWGAANVEVMRQAAALAEQTEAAAGSMSDRDWEALMGQVVRFATS